MPLLIPCYICQYDNTIVAVVVAFTVDGGCKLQNQSSAQGIKMDGLEVD